MSDKMKKWFQGNKFFIKLKNTEQLMLFVVFVAICIILSLLTSKFYSQTNIMNVLRQASMTGITAAGMTMIILLGCIDLSVGSQQALIGVFTTFVVRSTVGNIWLGVLAGIFMGVFIGFLSGLVITKLKIAPIIATLGMMTIVSGVAKVSTNAVPIQVTDPVFLSIGTGYVGKVPIPVIIWLVIAVIIIFILRKTAFGRYIYAIGGNENAARLAGIPVDRIKVIVYMISGVLTSIAAIILAARMNSGQPTAGTGFEMQVIAAVIIGGVSMSGGRGGLGGAIIGVLILSVLSNGLVLLDVNSFYQEIVRGAVIIAAVYIDERRRANITKKLIEVRFNEN